MTVKKSRDFLKIFGTLLKVFHLTFLLHQEQYLQNIYIIKYFKSRKVDTEKNSKRNPTEMLLHSLQCAIATKQLFRILSPQIPLKISHNFTT